VLAIFALVLISLTPLPLGRFEVHHATITGLITCHTGQPDCRYRIAGGLPAFESVTLRQPAAIE